jgi:hypothetical protein
MKRNTAATEREGGCLRRLARRLNNRGETQSGCIFIIILLIGAGYVGYLFSVPLFEYNDFESRISEMMPYFRHHDAEYIYDVITDTAAKDFDLTLEEDQVKVQVLTGKNRIIIDINYSKVVNLPFYAHTLDFDSHLTGEAF